MPLTFIQARVYLHHERPETLESIAEDFGLPLNKVEKSEKHIRKKVGKAMAERETLFGHDPLYSPGSEKTGTRIRWRQRRKNNDNRNNVAKKMAALTK